MSVKCPGQDSNNLALNFDLGLFSSSLDRVEITNPSIAIEPLTKISIVRINNLSLKKDFTFHDEKAIVIIEGKLNGPESKISILARNVIVCPSAELEVKALEVNTLGAAILLNVKATDVLWLKANQDAIIGNSSADETYIDGGRNALGFGINRDIKDPLTNYKSAIVEVLMDAVCATDPDSLTIKSQGFLGIDEVAEK